MKRLFLSLSLATVAALAPVSSRSENVAHTGNSGILAAESLPAEPAPTLVSVNGLTVTVTPFQAGSFSFSGGELAVVAGGVWFIGVDLYRNTLIALPRLGHRGWVPVARIVAGQSGITSVEQIAPNLPASRIPRTLEKIRKGQAVNLVVMGSSLAEGGGATTWSGMLFNASSSHSDYKIPGVGTFRNIGLGGTPNQYMLAQLGYALPSGRSSLLNDVDLVVLTCLANGGDYRLSVIEPIIRQLKKRGAEIILLTDNPQNPATTYTGMQNSGLYPDGSEAIRVAELYGIELADTAAYVFEQHLRYGSGIYSDAIHMKGGEPAGPSTAQPSGGNEVYARAVRSIISLAARITGTAARHLDFDDGVQGFTSYGAAAVASAAGKLKVVKTTGTSGQWGGWVEIPAAMNGDTLRVQGIWSFEDGYNGNLIGIGTQGGGPGWGSTVGSSQPGSFDVMITLSRDIISGGKLLFFGNNDGAPLSAAFSLDNVSITINPTVSVIDTIPDRVEEVLPLPPVRVVSDPKTPADAIIILPKDEPYHASNHAARGSLGSHPGAANSFARRFSSSVGTAEDLLTLTSGRKAVINATSAVGFSMIRHANSTDAPVTVEVRRNATLLKTLNLGAGYNREEYNAILTPTEYGQLAPMEHDSIELTVTAGALKVCAFVILAGVDILSPQTLEFPAIPNRTFGQGGDTVTLSATSSANLTPVSFSVTSGPATITGDILTITGAGEITVEATQSGNSTYQSATASRTFTVAKASQTISFSQLANRGVSSPAFTLSATASSGLEVVFDIESTPAGLAALDGSTLSLRPDTPGKVTVIARQPGNDDYLSAESPPNIFSVTAGPPTKLQSIAFAQPPAATYGDAPLILSATASSSLPVAFQLVSTAPATGVATLDDDTLTILGAGKVTVRATQPGAYPFKPAVAVTRTITVNKAPLAVSFDPASRLVREPNPVFIPHYTGFVNGDTEDDLAATRPIGVTKAALASPEGEYPITFKGGLDANYRFVAGEPAFLTVLGFGGAYEGLLVRDGVPAGKLELAVSKKSLAFTGTLTLASETKTLPVSGTLVAAENFASAVGSFSRNAKGVAALDLSFTIEKPGALSGSLKRNDEAFATVDFGQSVFVTSRTDPARGIGAYTMVLRPPTLSDDEDDKSVPRGAGHAAATIDSKGRLKLGGKLADGVPFTATLSPSLGGNFGEGASYRLFAKPYGKRLESFIAGGFNLFPHEDSPRFPGRLRFPDEALMYYLTWQKAESPAKPLDASYRDGFGPHVVEFTLDPWIAPAGKPALSHGVTIPAGTLVQRLNLGDTATSTTTVAMSFDLPEDIDFGARDAFLPASLNLSAKGAFTVPSPLPAKADNPAFRLKVTPATGAFAGSFTLSDVPVGATKSVTRKVSVSGTLRQGPDGSATLGHGHFLLDPSVDDTDTEQVSGEVVLNK